VHFFQAELIKRADTEELREVFNKYATKEVGGERFMTYSDLVLDYLQLVQGRGRGDNRVQEMSEISRAVKGMARELKVPVLACSQLSRAVEGRADHRPMLSDLRDSGSIEQDADIVMFIHREDLYYTEELWDQQFPNRDYPKNLAEIIVAKHRHGPTGSVKMRFRDNLVRFDALEVEDY